MKNTIKKAGLSLLLLPVMLFSCSEEHLEGEKSAFVKDVLVSGEDFIDDFAATRAAYTSDLEFSWTSGDTIGIYPLGGDQVAFPISNGEGNKTAQFDGGAWLLRTQYKYAAYYPYDNLNSVKKETELPVSYLGQCQVGDDSREHISKYDFQAAAATTPTYEGSVNLQMKHLGAFMRLKLTMPEAVTLTKVTVSSEEEVFVTEGIIDLSAAVPSIIGESSASSLSIDLESVATTEPNQEITVWMMSAPADLSGRTLTITAETSESIIYTGTVAGKAMGAGEAKAYAVNYGNGTPGGSEDTDNTPYVTFHAEGAQTLKMSMAVQGLEYSVNNGEWSTLGTTEVTFGSINGDLRLRGKNEYGTCTKPHNSLGDVFSSRATFGNRNAVSCSGDIRTLVDYELYETTNTENARFKDLFSDTPLTSAPELPATTLANNCYSGMFANSRLVNAPELPATILAKSCYLSMFSGCTSLVSAPELPATTLAYACYCEMFFGCNLSSAPELPATALASACYEGMFSHCGSLTVAPELPATTLAYGCYSEMFSSCTSLVTAPEILPAMSLAEQCYYEMFFECTSLETAPVLPAQVMAELCYCRMFKGCTKLNYVKMLALDIPSGSQYVSFWLEDVSPVGTIVKNKDATWSSTTLGIPSGWTEISIIVDENGNEVQIPIHNGHEYVDLGITVNGQKLLWATTNVGAETATSYGDYYAWGETSPYYTRINNGTDIYFSSSNPGYSFAKYKYAEFDGYNYYMTKYTLGNRSSYTKDDKSVLDPEDDAASKNWGGSWRTPTLDEFNLLNTQCCMQTVSKYDSDTYNGVVVSGFIFYKAKSEEDKGKSVRYASNTYTTSDPHIFLPVGGCYELKELRNSSDWGYYWTSSLCGTSSNYQAAYNVNFYINNISAYFAYKNGYERCYGYAVRPVCIIPE